MNFIRPLLEKITRPVRYLLAAPLKLMSAPQVLLGLSLPTRVALLVFLILLIVSVFIFYQTHYHVGALTRGPLSVLVLIISGLLIVIPLVIRAAVKHWLEGPPAEFPDIDEAWEEGIRELASQGVNLADMPIFLVHGAASAEFSDALLGASQQHMVVAGVPQRTAPLRWYATTDAIYLVALTELSQLAALQDAGAREPQGGSKQSMRELLSSTLQAMDGDGIDVAAGTLTGTTRAEPLSAAGSGPSRGAAADISATLMPSSSLVPGAQQPVSSGRGRIETARRDKIDARMRYVCRLLNRNRQPLAPANGILSLLPLSLLSGGHAALEDVQQAFRHDLETLRQGLRLRCPAIALVTGLEQELGFRELVRRIGPERARAGRFGKGSRLGTPPLADHVEAVTANACAAFEIFAYSLFREEGGLNAFGNPKLYALICRVRTEFRERLENVLAHAYGREPSGSEDSADNGLFFGGCYFAATGQQEDLQAFNKGVFERFVDPKENLQDHLEWTEDAKQEEGRYRMLAHVGYALDGVLLLIGVLLLLRAFQLVSI